MVGAPRGGAALVAPCAPVVARSALWWRPLWWWGALVVAPTWWRGNAPRRWGARPGGGGLALVDKTREARFRVIQAGAPKDATISA